MFEPLLGFAASDCTGQTHPQTNSFCVKTPRWSVYTVQGTTKNADAFGLFVYPNQTQKP
jgi:hypothetical protein